MGVPKRLGKTEDRMIGFSLPGHAAPVWRTTLVYTVSRIS